MAGLLFALPGLSYHFGLTKADVMDLTPAELEVYLDQLDQINRDARRR